MSRPRLVLSLGLSLGVPGVIGAGCRAAPPAAPAAAPSADTWAVVSGRAITRDEVEKAYRRTRDTAQALSPEEEMTAKLSVLNDLITQELLLARARALKIEIADSELDAAYADAKKNIPDEAFQKELSARQLTAADMREGLRRELLTQKVLEQEISKKVSVSDQEVTDFFTANRAQFNIPEESYHLAQIVITPVREPQITNATGDDAAQAISALQQLVDSNFAE